MTEGERARCRGSHAAFGSKMDIGSQLSLHESFLGGSDLELEGWGEAVNSEGQAKGMVTDCAAVIAS